MIYLRCGLVHTGARQEATLARLLIFQILIVMRIPRSSTISCDNLNVVNGKDLISQTFPRKFAAVSNGRSRRYRYIRFRYRGEIFSYREINFKLHCVDICCAADVKKCFLFFEIARNLNHSLKRRCFASTIKYTMFLHIASNLFYIYMQPNFFYFCFLLKFLNRCAYVIQTPLYISKFKMFL